MDSLIALLILLPFTVVFGVALRRFLHRRDAVSRDLTLMFGAVAARFALEIVELAVGPPPAPLPRLASAALLAQPLLALWLIRHVRPVRRSILAAAAAGWVATAVPLVVITPPAPASLTVLVVANFVLTEVAAALLLAGEARRRSGLVRVRLVLAAIAAAVFASAILVLGTGAADARLAPYATPVGRAMVLASALAYLVAFAPPRWLARIARAVAQQPLRARILELAADAPVDAILGRAATVIRDATAAEAVLLLGERGHGELAVLACEGCPVPDLTGLSIRDFDRSVAAGPAGAASSGVPPELRRLAPGVDAHAAVVVPYSWNAGARGLVVALSARGALFGEDDQALIAELLRDADLLVERRALLAEQERLALELNSTVDALRAASRAKSDFLASMSHELRTPLSAIIGFSELMRADAPDDAVVEAPAEWVEHIHRSANHLLALINDVLDLARVEAGRLDLDPTVLDLSRVVSESVAGLRPLADRKHLGLRTAVDVPEIVADRGRFRQVLYNLLSNAIKFTPEGGEIRVGARREGPEIEVYVEDTGIGIKPEDQAVVFEEFRQVGDAADREQGTGLGLALTRRLVEAHGGRMGLVSRPGVGSRFSAFFPADASAGASVAPEPAAAYPLFERDVLLIEDDPAGVRLLRAYLADQWIAIRVAPDGETGLAEARRRRPDAIILDVMLPRMDGWEVLRLLKQDEELRDVPVIVITVVDERGAGLALGATDYFVKPIARSALIDRLARLTFTRTVRERPVRVLAVDDDPADLELIRTTLAEEGFEVLAAQRGTDALKIAARGGIDLLICDLVMPHPDGFEVVAQMKASAATRDVPILILTGHEMSDGDHERLRGLVLGVAAKSRDTRDALRAWLGQVLPPAPDHHPQGARES